MTEQNNKSEVTPSEILDYLKDNMVTKEEFTEFKKDVDGRFDQVEGRLDGVEGRLDRVEGRLESIENHLIFLEKEMTQMRLAYQH